MNGDIRVRARLYSRSLLLVVLLCGGAMLWAGVRPAFGQSDADGSAPSAQAIETLREAMLAAYEYATIQHDIARAELDANAATEAETIDIRKPNYRWFFGFFACVCVLGIFMVRRAASKNSKSGKTRVEQPLWVTITMFVCVFVGVYFGSMPLRLAQSSTNLRTLEQRVETAIRALEHTRDGSLFECPPYFLFMSHGVSLNTWLDLVAAGGAYRDARTAYHAAQGVTLKPYDHGPPDAPPKY